MKAPLAEILAKAANVVESAQSYEIAMSAADGTSQRYLDHLLETVHMLKWAIERDRPGLAKLFRIQQGSALTPVVAILTVFTVGAVLIAQSGLVNALVARFAQVIQ